jgi:uncharacterized MAPEG superfamily protein
MNIPFLCVLIAGLLPYVATYIAKSRRDFDNRDPRGWLERLTGFRRRAHYAQLNGFETFPFFAVGVIIAYLAGADASWSAGLAVAFVVSRVLHLVFYLADRHILRSLSFTAGLACTIGLYVLALARTM